MLTPESKATNVREIQVRICVPKDSRVSSVVVLTLVATNIPNKVNRSNTKVSWWIVQVKNGNRML